MILIWTILISLFLLDACLAVRILDASQTLDS